MIANATFLVCLRLPPPPDRLIVDIKCLEHLDRGEACETPIAVAESTRSDVSTRSDGVFWRAFTIESADERRDFLLLSPIDATGGQTRRALLRFCLPHLPGADDLFKCQNFLERRSSSAKFSSTTALRLARLSPQMLRNSNGTGRILCSSIVSAKR